MIRLENVSKFYNTGTTISMGLSKVNLTFEMGEIVAIVGESGAGKSTLLNVITQMDTFEEGEIYYDDVIASTMTKAEIEAFRRDNVGFIFQNYNLIESYTVLQNAMMPLLLKGVPKKEAYQKAIDILDEVGLLKRKYNKATMLSGGEKQRLVIARALISDNKILACDEPTGNLDSKTSKEIIDLIYRVSKGRLVLIVSHNYDRIKDIVTRRIEVKDGSIIEDTSLKEFKEDLKMNPIMMKKDLRLRDYIKMSFRNLVATPKKTIFSFLVFMVAMASFLVLYSISLKLNLEEHVKDDKYRNLDSSRIVLYDSNYQNLDMEKINKIHGVKKVVENAFYEDIYYSGYITGTYVNQNASYVFLDNNYDKFSTLYGKMPENDDEVIISSYEMDLKTSELYIGSDINFFGFDDSTPDGDILKSFKIVGCYKSHFFDDLSDSLDESKSFVLYGNQNVMNYIKYSNIINNVEVSASDGSYIRLSINNRLSDNEVLYQTTDYKEADINVIHFDLILQNIYHIRINPTSISSGYSELQMNYHTLISFIDSMSFEVSLYANNKTDINSIINKAKSLGYNATSPYNSNYITSDNFKPFLTKVLSTVLIILSIIILYFISFFILTRIYQTKVKEYTLLRSIGASKKDLFHIVSYEFVLISFTTFILGILVCFILKFSTSLLIGGIFSYYKWYNLIIFFIVFMTLTYLIAYKVYRRIFKYSIQTSLKKEAILND